MKLYIEAKAHPWVTWDNDLWREAQKMSDNNLIITSIEGDADVKMVEYFYGMEHKLVPEKKYVVYVESIEWKHVDELVGLLIPIRKNVKILSDSVEVIANFKERGWYVERWNKPTRVSDKMIYKNQIETYNKTGGFVITTNGQRFADNLAEVLKTYFAMCLNDDPENEGELVCMQDVDIFSAYDLPFETFNNVYFHGLQPNPKMFKTIKNAKLFISPYNGDGVPINAVDAIMLGTPIIVRDTKVNRSVFNWDNRCFYRTEKELAKKIKFFSDISVDDPRYVSIVQTGFDAIIQTHSARKSLLELIYILQG